MTWVGTPLYIAPELVLNKPYSFNVDVWSVGCVLYMLATSKVPFKSSNLITLGHLIVNKTHPKIIGHSEELSNFVDKCLLKNPLERLSSE